MEINEAIKILNESGYILTESRGNAQTWIDEVLALDDALKDQIEEDLMEYYNAFEADNGMVYSRDVGEDSMADSVFDYVYEAYNKSRENSCRCKLCIVNQKLSHTAYNSANQKCFQKFCHHIIYSLIPANVQL